MKRYPKHLQPNFCQIWKMLSNCMQMQRLYLLYSHCSICFIHSFKMTISNAVFFSHHIGCEHLARAIILIPQVYYLLNIRLCAANWHYYSSSQVLDIRLCAGSDAIIHKSSTRHKAVCSLLTLLFLKSRTRHKAVWSLLTLLFLKSSTRHKAVFS